MITGLTLARHAIGWCHDSASTVVGDPTNDHGLGDPPLFRTGGKVDVGDSQANKRHSNQTMDDVDVAPC